jgi:hypothetical protein
LGKTLADHDAHHVFPEKFRKFFTSKGVDIDGPKFLQWWQKNSHRQKAYDYNLEWENWIKTNQNLVGTSQVLSKGREIMQKFGIPVNY